MQVQHWYGNSSMYESKLSSAKTYSILFAVLSLHLFRQGRGTTRDYDDQSKDLESQGPLA